MPTEEAGCLFPWAGNSAHPLRYGMGARHTTQAWRAAFFGGLPTDLHPLGINAYVRAHRARSTAILPVLTRTLATTTPKTNPPTWAKNATPLPPLSVG